MKVVILAGGFGTRLSEETDRRPKPMVEIGARPILWHIMKHYSYFGFNEFVIALGYRGDDIKEFFFRYHTLEGDLTIDLAENKFHRLRDSSQDWRIHLIDTGLNTMTGGRVKRLQSIIGSEPFMLTYGDGLSNIDLNRLLDFHRSVRPKVTVTAVHPPSRFGAIGFEGQQVTHFSEKHQMDVGWINGGFMVLEPDVFEYLEGDDDVLEIDLLERLAKEKALAAFKHDGYWQCMDTMRDKLYLEKLWSAQAAPWKVWDDRES